jgi:hypothetical protein
MASKIALVKKYFSKFWNANFLFSNALIPLAVLTLYLVSFSYFLPKGVNRFFAEELWRPALILTGLVGLAVIALLRFKKASKLTFKKSVEKRIASDLLLLLLPLTPVVQYIFNNQDILSLWESFYVFGAAALFAVFFTMVVPLALGKFGSSRTLMIVGLAFAFTITNMAALSQQFSWFEVGGVKIQLAVFSGVFLASWFLYDLNFKKLLYLLIAVYFVSNSVAQAIAPKENAVNKDNPEFTSNKLFSLIGERKPNSTPNIYLLVYDSYIPNETMLSHGIDNSAQENFLKKNGFKLYPKTYSVGASSLSTMSRVLNASTESYGNMRRATSGDGVVHNLLRDFGYQVDAVFPSAYFFRGVGSNFDNSYPPLDSSVNLLLKAVFLGEFRFDLEFDIKSFPTFVKTKLVAFSDVPEGPRFIDTHTGPGHTQNSGACLPNETALFEERLDKSNLEMRDDVETIVRNDPGAIVIVAGDHGPHLTKNCTALWLKYDISDVTRLDIQDRFGAFLAMRWPTKDFEKYDDITVLQDIFPSIFSYLFNDKELLESKIEPTTLDDSAISGAKVKNGIIHGGVNDGELLFESAE